MGQHIPTYPDLEGKVALVTGGSGGIGDATCRMLAANGAKVAVNGRNVANLTSPGLPVEEIPEEGWRASVEANLTATYLTIKSILPGMRARGAGAIVTMSSSAARLPQPMSPVPYAAAKAGVELLTRRVAQEAGVHGVRVNCLAPHTILVERTRRFMPEDQQRRVAAEIPLGRLGTPEDVALAALFLLSDASSWITGVTLDVAGGKVMG